ncbi:class I SAM-dependent methyltransferase [Nannocystis bainbridge]|uniref:Methyltransferase domain-containing protein n=1 Tax=Nannocystis bainbridge TaxID=2995303 RepID=A0ABT5ECQ5_9BACT|nr:class I SAM-dependent methyltransferase [Nannocystis bainbridge]MDC0723652.1 methyltransferase domain-containing protein [Nannocystis bainbridge]
MTAKQPRKTFLGVYLGDLRDFGHYLRQLWNESGFGQAFFDAKYERVDPWGYAASRYDELKRAMAAYGLQGRRARHLLDVGCGEGFLARHLRAHGERISLVDISAAAVERARARVEVAGEDHVGDALTVLRGLRSGEYDAIVISELLYYLAPFPFSRYGRALRREVMRVLAPGGLLVLVHPYSALLHAAYRWHPGMALRAHARLKTRRSVTMLALEKGESKASARGR